MGRLAKRPMQNVERAAIADVAVTISLLTSCTQMRYSELVAQLSARPSGGQTQVPPVSEVMLLLTEMIYAMAKNVAKPARSSVKKKLPVLSLGYMRLAHSKGLTRKRTHMA